MTSKVSGKGTGPRVDSGLRATTALPSPGSLLARWRESPERLAWLVIVLSFVVFVALAIAIPWTVNYTLQYLPVNQSARLDPSLESFFSVYLPDSGDAIAVTGAISKTITAGSVVEAASDATQGTLSLISDEEEAAAQVLGSLQIYSGTRIKILRLSRPFFQSWSSEPYQARLFMERGQARVFTNSGKARPLSVQLETPHGTVLLATGSYQISVEEARTEVTVVAGSATLLHEPGPQLIVSEGLRAWMTADTLPSQADTAQQNLIRNGSFTPPVLDSWQSYQGPEGIAEPGSVSFTEREGRKVAYFIHQASENGHNEVGITQAIEKKVDIYNSLVLQLDVNILFQNLPGAGYMNTEFPVRVEIDYTDQYGKGLKWGYGFYYRNPEPPGPSEVSGGEQVLQAQWHTYRSPNLLELLDQEGTRPSRINSIRIYASGWNYQSLVSEVYLYAE
ncbi:MAG: hypothetical protein KF832_10840 [Caldilineaceae bacterium]|nr:hypothetical protein [Caldilineaceae bacterium]